MGKFANQIEWCRKICDDERESLEPLEDGTMKHYNLTDDGPVDITNDLIEDTRNNISRLEKLIEAYEKHNDE
jgi:hypothetical protein